MQDARCLKFKPLERAFKQFQSPVLNVLTIWFIQVRNVGITINRLDSKLQMFCKWRVFRLGYTVPWVRTLVDRLMSMNAGTNRGTLSFLRRSVVMFTGVQASSYEHKKVTSIPDEAENCQRVVWSIKSRSKLSLRPMFSCNSLFCH